MLARMSQTAMLHVQGNPHSDRPPQRPVYKLFPLDRRRTCLGPVCFERRASGQMALGTARAALRTIEIRERTPAPRLNEDSGH